jgi:hypothetical protein
MIISRNSSPSCAAKCSFFAFHPPEHVKPPGKKQHRKKKDPAAAPSRKEMEIATTIEGESSRTFFFNKKM